MPSAKGASEARAIETLRPTAALWRYLRWDAGIFVCNNPELSRIPPVAIVGGTCSSMLEVVDWAVFYMVWCKANVRCTDTETPMAATPL